MSVPRGNSVAHLDHDPGDVKYARAQHESRSVCILGVHGLRFPAMGIPVENREYSEQRSPRDRRFPVTRDGRPEDQHGQRDHQLLHQDLGNGMRLMPMTAPIAMTRGKAIGSAQIRGRPSATPHIPTATIASG